MKGLDSVKQLDQQEEYLALVECLLRLELHQVVAHQAHSVRLREVSVALPSMVIAGLAIEPGGYQNSESSESELCTVGPFSGTLFLTGTSNSCGACSTFNEDRECLTALSGRNIELSGNQYQKHRWDPLAGLR